MIFETESSLERRLIEERRAKASAFIRDEIQIANRVLTENGEQQNAMREFESRPYQEDAWVALWQAREEGADKGLIRLATGLGKTPIAAFDYAKFRTEQRALGQSSRGLFVVHQNNILSQASQTFGQVLPGATRSRLSNKSELLPSSELTFATFQMLREGAQKLPPTFFDYIIYDEAHHIEADTYKKVVDYFQPQFQLGLTATPNRRDRRDITHHFGEPIYTKTLPEAISEGYLADVEYSVMSDDAIKRALRDGFQPRNTAEIRALFEVLPRNEEIVEKIKATQEKIRVDEGVDQVKTIVFCEDIQVAEDFAALLDGESYHSKMSDKQQQKVFSEFINGDTETLTVRDMLNEGVNVPDARLIIFLRTTQSKMIFEQQLGRGLRKAVGKDRVTVMDFVANIDRLILLEELAGVVFNEDVEKGFDDSDLSEDETVFIDEHNRFVFDQDIINLLHLYNQLIDQEGRNRWDTFSDEEIVQLALSISFDRPLSFTVINELGKDAFPSAYIICKRFGSISNFQRACGFDVIEWEKIDNETIIKKALELSPDEPLKYYGVRAMDRRLLPFPSMIVQRFGSWVEFQRACGFEITDWGSVNNEDIVKLALKLSPDEPLTSKAMGELDGDIFPSAQTVIKRFGGYIAFVQACGFEVDASWRNYSDQDIIDLALRLSPNRPLNTTDIRNFDIKDFPSHGLIYSRFGSITEFQKACGFVIQPAWSTLSDEQLGDIARSLSPERPLTKDDIDAFDKLIFPSSGYIKRRFGSLRDFNKFAGFDIGDIRMDWRTFTNDQILELAKKISPDAPLRFEDIIKLPQNTFPRAHIIYNRFGSLVEFQKACGFTPNVRKSWSSYSNEYLIEYAKELSPDKPLTMTAIDNLNRDDFPNSDTVARRFGSIAKFHEACGFDNTGYTRWGNWTNEDIVELALSISPTTLLTKRQMITLAQQGDFPGNKTIVERFGSVIEFQKLCGYDDTHEKTNWSSYSNEDIVELALTLSPDKSLSVKEINSLSKVREFPGLNFIKDRFSSMANFQRACGFEARDYMNWSGHSKEDIVKLALELSPNKPLSLNEIREFTKAARFPNPNFISKLFGSTQAFQEACGFKALRNRDN